MVSIFLATFGYVAPRCAQFRAVTGDVVAAHRSGEVTEVPAWS